MDKGSASVPVHQCDTPGANSKHYIGQGDIHNNGISLAELYGTLSVPQHVDETIHYQARHIFLHDTVVLTPSSSAISRGHFAGLCDLLNSPESTALSSAIDAVALTLLATRFGRHEARPLAIARYTCCIRRLRANDLASAASTRCLIACIFLLSL